jgi:hypothetical protein
MATYVSAFNTASKDLAGYVQNQLSTALGWRNIPGSLNKISASSTGHVWGFNVNGDIYRCKEPCDGRNWQYYAKPGGVDGMPLDINTDESNVYLLYAPPAPPPDDTGAALATGLIDVGDVGMPPGHIAPYYNGVIVSASFLGPGAAKVAELSASGKYTLTVKDEKGQTASVKITNMGSGGFYYVIYNNDFSGDTISKKFAGSRRMSVEVKAPAGPKKELPGALVAMRPVAGGGGWKILKVPGSMPKYATINLTDSFMFVGKKGCAKPCTTSAWVDISLPGSGAGGVVAASSGAVYAASSAGDGTHIYKSSQTGQGGWTDLKGLKDRLPVAVATDNQVIYTTNASSGAVDRCEAPYNRPTSCKPADMEGHSISGLRTLSVNPSSHQVYMTAQENGEAGNIFQRLDDMGGSHLQKVLQGVNQYDNRMDHNINSMGDTLKLQHEKLVSGLTRKTAIDVLRDAIKYDGDLGPAREETENLRRMISFGKDTRKSYQAKMLPLEIIIGTLAVVAVIFLVGGSMASPEVTSGVAILALISGFLASVYFAVVG